MSPQSDMTEKAADIILSMAVQGGREGLVVTAEDRDGADYQDCWDAAQAILAMLKEAAA